MILVLFKLFIYYLFDCTKVLVGDTQDAQLRSLGSMWDLFLSFFFFFSCSMPTLKCNMWDLVSGQGLNPGPLYWEKGTLAPGPPGKSLVLLTLSLHAVHYISKTYLFYSWEFGLFKLASPISPTPIGGALPASGNHQYGLCIHEYASVFKPRNNSVYFPFLSSFPTQSIFLVKSLSTGKRMTDSEMNTELFSWSS